MELCEVLTGWEQKNKYQVKDLRVFWNLIYFSLPDLRLSRTRDLLHEGGKQLLHEVSIQVVRLNFHQAWGNKNNWWFGDFYHLLPRQCCGPNRPFNFHVTDPAGLEVLHFKRFLPTWSWSTYIPSCIMKTWTGTVSAPLAAGQTASAVSAHVSKKTCSANKTVEKMASLGRRCTLNNYNGEK